MKIEMVKSGAGELRLIFTPEEVEKIERELYEPAMNDRQASSIYPIWRALADFKRKMEGQ